MPISSSLGPPGSWRAFKQAPLHVINDVLGHSADLPCEGIGFIVRPGFQVMSFAAARKEMGKRYDVRLLPEGSRVHPELDRRHVARIPHGVR